ncbi:hypothetical protein ACRN9O_08630 [Shewanella oncorhynchi]
MNSFVLLTTGATKYLEQLVECGFLTKQKVGSANYYINVPLWLLLIAHS